MAPPDAIQRPYTEGEMRADAAVHGFSIAVGAAASGGLLLHVIGRTDEIGLRAIERPMHVHDLHATIMHLMGLDHLRVTFMHNGRSERATVVDGELIKEVLA